IGKMDGFCVGEPWNARAIADGIGFTSLNTQDIWKDHPEKVCAFLAEFAEKNPRTIKAVLKALHEGSVWLDNPDNRPEQAAIVSQPTYINCPREIIIGRLLGDYDFGDGRKKQDANYMIFHKRNCNYPQPKYAMWWLTQFRRWAMVDSAPEDRKSTRLNSSHVSISYAVFCLKKKKNIKFCISLNEERRPKCLLLLRLNLPHLSRTIALYHNLSRTNSPALEVGLEGSVEPALC